MSTDTENRQTQTGTPAVAELKSAFDEFSRYSAQLEESYRDLQSEVGRLGEQLAVAREERQRQADEKERLSRRLRRLLEALPGGVVVLDGGGVVAESNPGATELLGEPLEGEDWQEVRTRAFQPDHEASGELTLNDGRKVSLARRSLRPDAGHVLLFTDVSESRAIQELLDRHRRLSAMGEMAATLAHQVRTPLATALLHASNAGREDLPSDARTRFAERAVGSLKNLEQLINDMLLFARGGNRVGMPLTAEEIVHDLMLGLEPQLPAPDTLIIDLKDRKATVAGNRQALVAALTNLAANALQAAGDHAQLELSVGRGDNDTVEFILADNGPGIDADTAARIFDPFFTTRPDGTGLGLAVVKAVAEAHDGQVLVESTPGQGARFIIRLPAARPAVNDDESAVTNREISA